jgi:hypothetical protein
MTVQKITILKIINKKNKMFFPIDFFPSYFSCTDIVHWSKKMEKKLFFCMYQ